MNLSKPQAETILIETKEDNTIECKISHPKDKHKQNQIAIICHPHPLYDGNMDNKVVITLKRIFDSFSIPTIRFNFRGIGNSSGQYGNGVGEQNDLIEVIDFMNQKFNVPQIWLSGFSFGSFIVANVSKHYFSSQIIHLTLVAPPIDVRLDAYTKYILPSIFPESFPITIVQGSDDEVLSSSSVKDYYHHIKDNDKKRDINMIWLDKASHFFHGRLIEMQNELKTLYKLTHNLLD